MPARSPGLVVDTNDAHVRKHCSGVDMTMTYGVAPRVTASSTERRAVSQKSILVAVGAMALCARVHVFPVTVLSRIWQQ